MSQNGKKGKSKKPKDEVPPFLRKTCDMLEDEANSDIIAWKPEGDSFQIYDGERLADDLLPRYFKHNNLCSFIRQLHTYGFRKVARDPKVLEFKHSKFIRGERELLKEIKRRTSVKRQAPMEEEDGTNHESTERISDTEKSLRHEIKRLRDDKNYLEKKLNTLEKQQHETQDLLMNQLQQMHISNMKLQRREEQLLQLLLQQQLSFKDSNEEEGEEGALSPPKIEDSEQRSTLASQIETLNSTIVTPTPMIQTPLENSPVVRSRLQQPPPMVREDSADENHAFSPKPPNLFDVGDFPFNHEEDNELRDRFLFEPPPPVSP